jgi:hypothetical protein
VRSRGGGGRVLFSRANLIPPSAIPRLVPRFRVEAGFWTNEHGSGSGTVVELTSFLNLSE